MSDSIEIDFEGRKLAARPGESLAATLTANGILALRTTRCDSERGIFCGMGVCQDCLVEVDGRPSQRACMTVVDRSLTVRREAYARPLPSGNAATAETVVEHPEMLVIGGGPGGNAAAIRARSRQATRASHFESGSSARRSAATRATSSGVQGSSWPRSAPMRA